MSSSTLPKLLLDENVRAELLVFLRERGIHARGVNKGASDRHISALSRREKRVIVTNDGDFTSSVRGEVFGVILLRLPQHDPALLIRSFEKMLRECGIFADRCVVLDSGGWKTYVLPKELLRPARKDAKTS